MTAYDSNKLKAEALTIFRKADRDDWIATKSGPEAEAAFKAELLQRGYSEAEADELAGALMAYYLKVWRSETTAKWAAEGKITSREALADEDLERAYGK